MDGATTACRICGRETTAAGVVTGRFSGRRFVLGRCGTCGFAFVEDPWLDYVAIYDSHYYAGRGADPLVDYAFELNEPRKTIRIYEWKGIARCVHHLTGRPSGLRWMDYGCGNGGLVRHLRGEHDHDAIGYETGAISEEARRRGIPIIENIDSVSLAGTFDVVTAVEVIEHTADPVAELCRMRQLLRPGGLVFLTTGNAAPFADRLAEWRYVTPEIHISFFEPRTLAFALRLAGFAPITPEYGRGFDQIMKFKVLKNLRVKRRSVLTDLVPSRPLALLADGRTRLSHHPVGWAT